MTNLTKEEYAKLHLKAKRGLLTPEEQAVYFEYREEQAGGCEGKYAAPVQPQTPPVQNVAYGQPQMQGAPYGQPVYGAPMGNQNPGAFSSRLWAAGCVAPVAGAPT